MKYLLLITLTAFSMNLTGQNYNKIELKDVLQSDKTYGAYCGIAGTHPPTRLIVEELIANKEIETLSDWLDSPNLVMQTYAAEAFIRLNAKGVNIPQNIYDSVDVIKNKEDLISTCKGCIYDRISIKEALKDVRAENQPESEAKLR